MSRYQVVLESVRSVAKEGREFLLSYSLALKNTTNGPEPYMTACAKQRTGQQIEGETQCQVDMSLLDTKVARRIFETIACAEEPVFPVHLHEIIHDQVSSSLVSSDAS